VVEAIQKHPVCLHPMCRHESQRQTHKHRNNASPIPKEQEPQKAQKRVLIFDANANPPQHAREPRPPVEVHRKHRKQRDKRGEGGAKTRPVARLSATRRSSRPGRRTTPQQPCREKRGDHHSQMKHSKRRMLGTYDQGWRHAPNCSRPASRHATSSR